ALEVFQRAIEKAGSLDHEKVRDAIAATNLQTAYGPIRFDAKGINIAKAMAVVQVQGGKPIVVWPAKAAEGPLRYPRN
ncbi:MAG TPA: hypothetical protein VFJ24_03975, partial [Gaiellales bacterium]|nr:hypothetical protein [Gaiellales bacterium]